MVRHQHPRPDFDARRCAMFAEQIAVGPKVIIAKEGLRAAVAALRDVARMAGKYRAGKASHADML